MRFYFVDKIHTFTDDKITGEKKFLPLSPLREDFLTGRSTIVPGVIGEAIGQLASWLAMHKTAFRYRPVYMFSDKLEITGRVAAGETIFLAASVHKLTEDAFIFSGEAQDQDGRSLVRIKNCTNGFMPVEQLEDPKTTSTMFEALNSESGFPTWDEGEPFTFDKAIGAVSCAKAGFRVGATARFHEDSAFYADHFPRYPVTPVVLLNEVIGRVAANLWPDRKVTACAIEKLKIRSFVKPGEEFAIDVCVDEDADGCESLLNTKVALLKADRPILRGIYKFRTLH